MADQKCQHGISANKCVSCNPYPYTHHGPAVHGSKLVDFYISEANRREARPDLFEPEEVAQPKKEPKNE